MTSEQFIAFAREMRDLGAVEVTASETGYSAVFGTPKPAVRPAQTQPEPAPEPKTYRDRVLTGLSRGR